VQKSGRLTTTTGKLEQVAEKEKLVKLPTLWNINLIGELFKQKLLPEKIVHACIQELLDGAAEETKPFQLKRMWKLCVNYFLQ
jgi:hypothetical protein